jgi:hypothetical protein
MLKLNPKHEAIISSGHMTTKPVRNTIRLVMIFVLTTAIGYSATAYNITISVYAEEEEEQAVAIGSCKWWNPFCIDHTIIPPPIPIPYPPAVEQ